MTIAELRGQINIEGRVVISHYDEDKDKDDILFNFYSIESASIPEDVAEKDILYMYPFYDGEIVGIKIEV